MPRGVDYDFWSDKLSPYLKDVLAGKYARKGLERIGKGVRAGIKGDYRAFGDAMGDFVGGGIASKGKALAMDAASRMQRARNMGFDINEPIYHGSFSKKPIKSFKIPEWDIGVHVGVDPTHASNRMKSVAFADGFKEVWGKELGMNYPGPSLEKMKGAHTYKLFGKKGKALEMDDPTVWSSSVDLSNEMLNLKFQKDLPKGMVKEIDDIWEEANKKWALWDNIEYMDADEMAKWLPTMPKEYDDLLFVNKSNQVLPAESFEESIYNQNAIDKLRKTLQKYGYNKIKYVNQHEGVRPLSKMSEIDKRLTPDWKDHETISPYSYVFLDPADLRSVNAAFDPKKIKSSDIMASALLASPIVGGVMMAGEDGL